MKSSRFSVRQRLRSFAYAFAGLRLLIGREHNARIHVVAAVMAMVAGFLLHLSVGEWLALVLSMALVLALEAVNSAIERLADVVSPGKNEQIGQVKDLAAAAVLCAAIAACIVGLLIFAPKIWALF